MSEVQEIPLDVEPTETSAMETTPSLEVVSEASAEAPPSASGAPPKTTRVVAPSAEAPQSGKVKPKAKGRPKGARDKAPRQVTRPAKVTIPTRRARSPSTSASEEDLLDDRMVEQATLLHVLRDMQRYQSSRVSQKQQKYASWFGR